MTDISINTNDINDIDIDMINIEQLISDINNMTIMQETIKEMVLETSDKIQIIDNKINDNNIIHDNTNIKLEQTFIYNIKNIYNKLYTFFASFIFYKLI